MAKAEIKAPYDDDGNLLHYPSYRIEWVDGVRIQTGIEWREIAPFTATLTFNGQHRGRSAAYFEWLDEAGHKLPMFLADIADLIRAATITTGVVRGRWVVQKRGQNYGIRPATEKDG